MSIVEIANIISFVAFVFLLVAGLTYIVLRGIFQRRDYWRNKQYFRKKPTELLKVVVILQLINTFGLFIYTFRALIVAFDMAMIAIFLLFLQILLITGLFLMSNQLRALLVVLSFFDIFQITTIGSIDPLGNLVSIVIGFLTIVVLEFHFSTIYLFTS